MVRILTGAGIPNSVVKEVILVRTGDKDENDVVFTISDNLMSDEDLWRKRSHQNGAIPSINLSSIATQNQRSCENAYIMQAF